MSQFFESGGQSIGVSASTSVLPMNTQDWSPLEWTDWISCNLRDSQEPSPTPQLKSINSSVLSFLYSPTLTSVHDYWKTIALTRRTLVGKVMSLHFNMLSRLVITSFQGVISLLQSPSTVIFGAPPKIKSVTVYSVSPSIFHEVMGPDAMILVFWMLSFKPSSFTFIARDGKRAQTNLVDPRTQGHHRDWDRTVFEGFLWRCRSGVDCHRDRGSGCSSLGHGISPLGRGRH